MLQSLVAAILAAAVTVAEGGLVFQPALSPDGKRVAYAAEENGDVAIYVVPSDASAPRKRVAVIGGGVRAHRLASAALSHAPWSPDGESLLYLAPGPDGKSELLYLASLAKGDARLLGPASGIVENASFMGRETIVYTYRADREDGLQTLYTVGTQGGIAAVEATRLGDEAVAVDVVPSPDGKHIAMLCLVGPRDERTREVRVFDVARASTTRIDYTAHASFLTWSADAKRLYFLDQRTREVPVAPAGLNALEPPIAKGLLAILDVEGLVVGLDGKGDVVTVLPEGGAAPRAVARGFVPVSSAAGRIAFVRKGEQGAAIVVTDGGRAALESGDLGLPRPEGAAPAPPPSPGGAAGGGSSNAPAPPKVAPVPGSPPNAGS